MPSPPRPPNRASHHRSTAPASQLFHGLGFLLSSFRSKNLVAPRLFADADGETELAWSFHPTTLVAEAARQHYQCNATDLWYPLLTQPALGASNHWSTRLLHDAAMSTKPNQPNQPLRG